MPPRPERLGFDDAQILRLESAAITGQTCKLVILDRGSEGAMDLDRLRSHLASRIARVPRLRQRVQAVPLRLGPPVWVDDERFEIADHVAAAPVAGPLDRLGLRALLAEVMATRLDHGRPLWRFEVAPLEGGGTAMIGRIHHCMADGIAAVRMLSEVLWTEEREDGGEGPAEERDRDRNRAESVPSVELEGFPRPAPSPARLAAEAVGDRLRSAGRGLHRTASAMLGREGRRGAARTLARLPGAAVRELRPARGRSPFDLPVGGRREAAFASMPVAEMRDLGHAVGEGVTVNDVLMATMAGGLREWLPGAAASPGGLRAQVPVSLHHRSEAPGELGNRDSFMNVDLPLAEADPVRRVLAVNEETSRRKTAGDPDEMYRFFHSLSHLRPLYRAGMRAASGPREFALAISNVPGPREPVRVMGAPVSGLYSLSEPAPHHALRVSAISLAGEMQVGFCSDPGAVTGVDALAEAVGRSLAELRETV